MKNSKDKWTDFGYQRVTAEEKTARVNAVFSSVASRYDLMNDVMSMGIHRAWKRCAVNLCRIRHGQIILDLAAGTGDLAARMSPLVGPRGRVVLADINADMLRVGQDRLIDRGICANVQFVQANAEDLPFADNCFDRIIIGFGLRNVTHQEQALMSMYRVLKPGGILIILEFSHPTLPVLQSLYDKYSLYILPWLGRRIVHDEDSYRYLAESIRMHPNQQTLVNMMTKAGFEDSDYHNLTGGIVALHRGYKF